MDRTQTLRAWGAGIALSLAAVSAAQAVAHQKAIEAIGVICGQGPSDHPDFALWLADQGIASISLNPDSVIDTWQRLAAK